MNFHVCINLLLKTDKAAERIKELISKKEDQNIVGIKIGLRTRGCNGLTYTMNYCKQNDKYDEIVKDKGIFLVIDSKALLALVGTEMDYVEDDLRAEFVFNNPNSKGTCGCGESFYV